MNMDQRRNCVNARSLPVSNALYGSSTVRSEREPLHRRPDVVLNEQGLPLSSEQRRLKKLVHENKIRFGTWNIGTLNNKSWEVVGVMNDRKINILCLQETKWSGEKSREINGFKLWYTGKVNGRNGVGIIADEEWKKNVVEVKRVEDRIISLRMIVGKDIINIISAYAPQVGAEAHLKEKFWEDIEELIQSILLTKKVLLEEILMDMLVRKQDLMQGLMVVLDLGCSIIKVNLLLISPSHITSRLSTLALRSEKSI